MHQPQTLLYCAVLFVFIGCICHGRAALTHFKTCTSHKYCTTVQHYLSWYFTLLNKTNSTIQTTVFNTWPWSNSKRVLSFLLGLCGESLSEASIIVSLDLSVSSCVVGQSRSSVSVVCEATLLLRIISHFSCMWRETL